MNQPVTVLSAVIPVFGIIVLGWGMRKLAWLTEEADQSLLRVNINLLFPCLVLDSVLGNPALAKASNLIIPPLVGWLTIAGGMVVAWVWTRIFRWEKRQAARTFAATTGIYNYSYIPVPLALLLFPGAETTGVLFVHNVGVEFAMWTIGVMLFSGTTSVRDWRKIVNGPLIAIVLALLLNAVGASRHIPVAVMTGIHWLGQCAIPMALILIGAVVADYAKDFRSTSAARVITSAVILRLALLPLLFLLIARSLPFSIELKRVMVLEAAMPAAVFPIVMSRHYHGDPPTALQVVLGTSLVGLVTIPLWIRFGLRFVGL